MKDKTKNSSDKKEPHLQASTKNNIKSVSPLKEEIFSTGIHRNKISKLWDCFSLYPIIYSLSLSIWRKTKNERKEKKKDICGHVLFIYDISDTLKVYIYV